VLVWVNRNPDGIFDTDESGFLEQITESLPFIFSFFRKVKDNDSPITVPIV